VGFRLVS